jgi:hypothetical protein
LSTTESGVPLFSLSRDDHDVEYPLVRSSYEDDEVEASDSEADKEKDEVVDEVVDTRDIPFLTRPFNADLPLRFAKDGIEP